MKKTVLKLGLSALLATNIMVVGQAFTGFDIVQTAEAAKTEMQAEAKKVKGKITNISQKAKTIALAQKDKSFFLVRFTDDTTLDGVKSSKEFKVGEAIIVNYTSANGENVATSLEKALVKLPKGIKEIKTEQLVDLIATQKGLVVIDARPPIKYAEGHIPGSISIPFSKLIKMGDDGAKLLAKYKDSQLVFYCGGPT
jgi:predicted sulfurtransferase